MGKQNRGELLRSGGVVITTCVFSSSSHGLEGNSIFSIYLSRVFSGKGVKTKPFTQCYVFYDDGI